MKKILNIAIVFSLSILHVSANVDQTNPFSFTYNCDATNGGILTTDFNLGGHHHYVRSYHIDNPGIMEIADATHTTVSKSIGITISGCNYTPKTCNVSSYGKWSFVSKKAVSTIHIETQLPIIRKGNTLIIDGQNSNDSIHITGFNNTYQSSGKKVTVDFQDAAIILNEEEDNQKTQGAKITYENRILDGQKEYLYVFSADNTNVELQKYFFSRSSTGTIISSSNPFDLFLAYTGYNTGEGSSLLSGRTSANGYSTGLDIWDFTQHAYTTTGVKIYPVMLSCSLNESSNGISDVTSVPYVGSLNGIIQPKFGGSNIQLNGLSQDSFGGFSLAATGTLSVDGLEYLKVGKINGKAMGVSKISVSIKENDITKGVSADILIPNKTSIGIFDSFPKYIDIAGRTKIAGNYQLVFSFFDGSQQIGTYEIPLFIFPNVVSGTNSLLSLSSSTPIGTEFANNVDYYDYIFQARDEFGNVISGLKINGINQDCNNGSGCHTITTNMVNGVGNTGRDALIEYDFLGTTDTTGKIHFKLKSLAPGVFSNIFKVSVSWVDFYSGFLKTKIISLSNTALGGNSFQKLFASRLDVSNDDGATWGGKITFGTTLKYKLQVIAKKLITDLQYMIDNFQNNISVNNPERYSLVNISLDKDTLNNSPLFTAAVNIATGATSIQNNTVGIKMVPNPIIHYTLGGQQISYRLSQSETDYIDAPISLENVNMFLGVQIFGSLQGAGNQNITGQNSNFSDISKQEVAAKIHKNAYGVIGNIKSNTLLNGVKYVEGDIELSGDQDYETLVVKDGNVIIKGDLNPSNKAFGIIVLKDGYNVLNGASGKGNIYVTPNVTRINAIMYADGGLISADMKGIPYTQDSSKRTLDLQNQLVVYGTLFTRNTIGGSVIAGGRYLLPGDTVTTDFNNAMVYDLNYVRTGKKGCEKVSSLSSTCKYDTGALVFIYNPNIQTQAPKLFSN